MTQERAPVNSEVQATIAFAQAEERLRQERETFDQHKRQNTRWFLLRLTMGWAAVVLLPTIMVVCSWIIFHAGRFAPSTVGLATSALLVDTLGLLVSIWRIVLGTRGPEALSPVTQHAVQRAIRK